MNHAFSISLLDPEQPIPSGFAAWNDSDPSVRFAVYRNNVMVSLIGALAGTFPVTQELVGEEFFREMARVFVRQNLPRSPVLTFYGESFPDFIERFPPAATVPYLADVARLEFLRVRAYHADDARGPGASVLAQALENADTLAMLQIAFQPALGLIRSSYAAASIWAAHQGSRELAEVDPYCAECALILRPEFDVEVITIDAAGGDFVAQLIQGECLAHAVEHSRLAHRDFDLARLLNLLIRKQAIVSISYSRPPKLSLLTD